MERDGHNKRQAAPQIAASCRSKLDRTLGFVPHMLSYLGAFFVSVRSYHILASNCSEKVMLFLILSTILRDTEKNSLYSVSFCLVVRMVYVKRNERYIEMRFKDKCLPTWCYEQWPLGLRGTASILWSLATFIIPIILLMSWIIKSYRENESRFDQINLKQGITLKK